MTDIHIPRHTLISYIRDRRGRPVGALVAVKADGGFRVGYSLCRRQDRFCKRMAIKIAVGRGLANAEETSPGEIMPHAVRKALPEFKSRCERYYA